MDKRLLFVSERGATLPVMWRLIGMGVPCRIYIHDPRCRTNYEGVFERLGPRELKGAIEWCDKVFVDMVQPMKGPREDSLLRAFGVTSEPLEVFGAIALSIRKMGKEVLCASLWTGELEMNRGKGIELAQEIGLAVPEFHEFKSIKAGVKFLAKAGKGKEWFFKPAANQANDLTMGGKYLPDYLENVAPTRFGTDAVDYLLQAKVEGVEMSSELWFDGTDFILPNRTFESKKLMDDDKGCSIGCQQAFVWVCKNTNGVIFKNIKRMADRLKKAKFVGCIDANCIISQEDHKPYFLEWSCRPGYDALQLLLTLIPKEQWPDFFLDRFKAKPRKGYAASQRITLDPYPSTNKKELETKAKDNLLDHQLDDPALGDFFAEDIYRDAKGKLRCAGVGGNIGVMVGVGETPEASIQDLYKKIDKLNISGGVQHRTKRDMLDMVHKRFRKLLDWEIDIF